MITEWEYAAVDLTRLSARAAASLVAGRTAQGWTHLVTAAHPARHGGGAWAYFKRSPQIAVAAT